MTPRATILIVDDDPEMRDYIARSLQGRPRVGDLLHAEDGDRAWAILREGRVQVLLTDLNLARLDGLALCERVAADSALAPVSILLVSGDVARRQAATQFVAGHGHRAVLFKPFNATELRAAVDRLLDALAPAEARAAPMPPSDRS